MKLEKFFLGNIFQLKGIDMKLNCLRCVLKTVIHGQLKFMQEKSIISLTCCDGTHGKFA